MEEMTSGVYQILNTVNNKCYIGQSYCVEKRLKDHFSKLRKNCHSLTHLQNAFNFYGEQAFVTKILVACNIKYLTQIEQKWMNKLKPEYNKAPAAGSNRGIKLGPCSLETKAKISAANMGHFVDKQRNQKSTEAMRKANIGNTYRLGQPVSKETRHKISKVMKISMIGNTNGKGGKGKICKPHSVETKAKISTSISLWWKKRKKNANVQ